MYLDSLRPVSAFTTNPTNPSVTDSASFDSVDTVSLVIGMFVALAIFLPGMGIVLFCWTRIIQAKKPKLNRQVSVGNTVQSESESHIYDSIMSINAQAGVTFGEGQTEETGFMSGDISASAINQFEEQDTRPEAAIDIDISSEATADTRPEVAISFSPEAAVSSIVTSSEAAISSVDTALDTSHKAAVTEDVCPIMTSSNPAYGCTIEKVNEDHAYENVDLFEATTLFYTTSDGTRTYRPHEQATEREAVHFGEGGEIIATKVDAMANVIPPAITEDQYHTNKPADFLEDTSPEAAFSFIDKNPEAAISSIENTSINTTSEASIDTSHKTASAVTDDACPLTTSSNPAYGCAIEKVNEDHTYMNVDLFEATTLFYTTSDGTRTYRPREQEK